VVGKEVPPSTDPLTPHPPGEGAATERDTARSFVRHSAVMSVGTALSRVTGFMRLFALAYALGQAESRLADSFNVANTTPNMVYDLALGGIISSVFIPVLVQRMERGSQEDSWHTARSLITFSCLLLTAITVLTIIGSRLIIDLYTLGVPAGQREAERALGSFFLRWFMPQIILYGLGAGVWTGLLNAHRKFGAPTFAPIVNNLIATATFFAFALVPGARHGTTAITTQQKYILAVGTTLGVVGMTLVLWRPLRKLGFRWRWTLDFKDPGFRRIGRLAIWAFAYAAINQAGLLVVILLAGKVRGGYSAYQSAFIFFQLPYAIFAVSIMTALLPSLSARWSDGEITAFRYQFAQGVRGMAFIIVPAALGYIALAVPIVTVLLKHGVMGEQSVHLLAGVLVLFSVGLLSFCTFQLELRAFYAMQDTRTPAVINFFAVAVNVIADVIYFRYLKVEGLALGHATAYTFAAVVAGMILRRRLHGLEGRRLSRGLAKIGVGGLFAAGAAILVSRTVAGTLGTSSFGLQLLQVIGAVTAGMLAYLAVAVVSRMEELTLLKQLVLDRIGRR
jgi:putative peptidoglycan lipid II flippase